jgi:hypothetical protein
MQRRNRAEPVCKGWRGACHGTCLGPGALRIAKLDWQFIQRAALPYPTLDDKRAGQSARPLNADYPRPVDNETRASARRGNRVTKQETLSDDLGLLANPVGITIELSAPPAGAMTGHFIGHGCAPTIC